MPIQKVFVVSVLGLEGEFEAVAAFSYRKDADDYVSRLKFVSWAIEELSVDEENECA